MKTPFQIVNQGELQCKQSDILSQIVDRGYSRVDMVLEPGDIAQRGSIIDVFPVNFSHPVRLEFDDEDLDRCMSFNPHSQRSLSVISELSVQPMDPSQQMIVTDSMEAPDREYITSLFHPGDYIVHEEYGVGLFDGLIHKKLGATEGEFIQLSYQHGDVVFVPLAQLNKLHKYSESNLTTKLTSLREKTWQKTKKTIQASTQKLADSILKIHRLRNAREGIAHDEDSERQLEMELAFEHQLTKDQQKAIESIKKDMESTRPMDRLLCGDVGYGKTEVMMRAAFKAIESKKQVIVLVPTTILAWQHYKTFSKRFANFDINVACVSRFQTTKEIRLIKQQLKAGTLSCVVGTHKLLNSQFEYHDLGLLIIDEEQRFGVAHKEKIKSFRSLIDVLSVSATPIPRTLYMALTGTRELSTIQTPPVGKKPVITHVKPFDEEVIEKAIQTEFDRSGQVFYIYNRVDGLQGKVAMCRRLFPKARVVGAHGQLSRDEFQSIMMDFYEGRIDILVATTIIENGVDVVTANTLIIDSAELLGLSQIHQIRGRVGRRRDQGYAYLLYSQKQLSDEASQRLQAIKEYVTLGAGYQLAMKDLEIRGAGNILGKEQHGHLMTAGFSYYCKLLQDAVNTSKGQKTTDASWLELDTRQLTIPESYIPSARDRLAIYRRCMMSDNEFDIDEIIDECEDRYGQLPYSVLQVFNYVKEAVRSQKVVS